MSAGMRYHSAEVRDVATYIADNRWAMEQKFDGIRCIVACDLAGNVTFTGHAGNPLRSGVKHHAAIAAELAIPGLTVDGELLADGTLWLFDILNVGVADMRPMPFEDRRAMLVRLFELTTFTRVHLAPSAVGADAKSALWEAVTNSGGEGVVVKRLTGTYSTGGRTRDVLKIKVTRTVDAVVIGFGSATDSAVIGLPRDGGFVQIGKCSLIGKPTVEIGTVIEVQYLYVLDAANPTLVQARLMRVRTDKTIAECDWEQLEGAVTSKLAVAV